VERASPWNPEARGAPSGIWSSRHRVWSEKYEAAPPYAVFVGWGF